MVGDKLLQCESVCAGIGAACRQGRGFQRSSLSQQSWALPGVNLAGSDHVETGVRMHVIVPRVELADVKRSNVVVWSEGPYTGTAEGEVLFSNGIRLRMREELDFDAGLITAYGYEVYRGSERLYRGLDFSP